MQKHIHILATDQATGIILAHYINSDHIFAIVNSKPYNIIDYRPINGNGRRLYSDSQTACKYILILVCYNGKLFFLI